jgi:hypothetical protein
VDCHRDERDQRERHQADVITLTGNKALQCFNTAYVVVVQSDPIVREHDHEHAGDGARGRRSGLDCAGSNAGGGVYGPGITCADGSFFTDPGVILAPVGRHP